MDEKGFQSIKMFLSWVFEQKYFNELKIYFNILISLKLILF